MSQTSLGEGTKIAQAAKDLNVTSVTIRRYLAEFNIETSSDDNGVKVLPPQSMEELQEIRKHKEAGLSNPEVLEILEKGRKQYNASPKEKSKLSKKDDADKPARSPVNKSAKAAPKSEINDAEHIAEHSTEDLAQDIAEDNNSESGEQTEGESTRLKHSLTCQTCGKNFEHVNPRLRDCLECYRTKRKERRRGGGHKNVIQHPLAQQVTTKNNQIAQAISDDEAVSSAVAESLPSTATSVFTTRSQPTVRNYRKAIEDTRHITSNLKRRLDRPDLPDGERRWLEQIYAYQLILHQGWRHLLEYKSENKHQQQLLQQEQPEATS